MVKKQPDISDIFTRTDSPKPSGGFPQDNSDLDSGRVSPIGIGLTSGEIDALDALAAGLGVKRHALLKIAARLLIVGLRSGTLDISEYLEEIPAQRRVKKLPR